MYAGFVNCNHRAPPRCGRASHLRTLAMIADDRLCSPLPMISHDRSRRRCPVVANDGLGRSAVIANDYGNSTAGVTMVAYDRHWCRCAMISHDRSSRRAMVADDYRITTGAGFAVVPYDDFAVSWRWINDDGRVLRARLPTRPAAAGKRIDDFALLAMIAHDRLVTEGLAFPNIARPGTGSYSRAAGTAIARSMVADSHNRSPIAFAGINGNWTWLAIGAWAPLILNSKRAQRA